MPKNKKKVKPQEISAVVDRLLDRFQKSIDTDGAEITPGWLFHAMTIYFHKASSFTGDDPEAQSSSTAVAQQQQQQRLRLVSNFVRFGGASVQNKMDTSVTHIIVEPGISSTELSNLRGTLAKQLGKSRKKLAHIVKVDWIEESWKEKTLLDEERTYALTFVSHSFFLWFSKKSLINAL
jgi:DNA ligase-4